MENQNSQLFLRDTDGNRVPVSQQVYNAYWRYTNKEDYFMRLLKEERFRYDPERQIAEFLPSREDSLDRLMEEGEEFALDQHPVEDQVINSTLVHEMFEGASDNEKDIIMQTYVLGESDDRASQNLHIPKTTFESRRKAMLDRLRRLYDDSS